MSISDVSCGRQVEVQRSVYGPRGLQNREGTFDALYASARSRRVSAPL